MSQSKGSSKEFHVSEAASQAFRYEFVPKSDSEVIDVTENGSMRRDGIGFRPPLMIVGPYVVSLICAIGHYIFFRSLNETPIEDCFISQSYVSALSISITFLFKTCVVASLWAAITQWLWRNFRAQASTVGTIDKLIRIPHDPTSLLNWRVFGAMPLLSTCALATWLVGIATIFPPGGLIIQPRVFQSSTLKEISVFDPEIRGDGTVLDLVNNALFTLRDTGEYVSPKPSISRLAKKTILLQEPLSGESPCGQNCSFSVQIPGPSYVCHSGLDTGPMSLPDSLIYYGNQTRFGQEFLFEANWTSYSNYSGPTGDSEIQNSTYETITCAMNYAIYDLEITYLKGKQSAKARSLRHTPLPSINLTDLALFDPQVNRTANGTLLTWIKPFSSGGGTADLQLNGIQAAADNNSFGYIFTPHVLAMQFSDSKVLPGFMNVTTALKLSSIRALHEALILAIGGGTSGLAYKNLPIQDDSSATFKIWDDGVNITEAEANRSRIQVFDRNSTSLILDSKMASFSLTDSSAVWLNITAESLQELLTNATISLLTIPNTQRITNVTSIVTRNVYAFAKPVNILLPYGITLLEALFVVAVGLIMLWRNGTEATVGGFLQIVESTQGSAKLRDLVVRGELGKDELKELSLRYGNLTVDRDGCRMLGFGTKQEVSPLL